MEIRAARVADAARMGEVHVRSWQAAYRGQMPQDHLDTLDPARSARMWERRLAAVDWTRGGCLVAADEAGVAGFADFGPARDDDADPALTGQVTAIYLAPAAWSTGCGRALMTGALVHLAGAGYQDATLWVLDTNARARSFYAKAGFAADGAVKLDERDGFTLRELRYRRPLP
jgi:ribosomal protein S18 acetylase RimI-like enzyme